MALLEVRLEAVGQDARLLGAAMHPGDRLQVRRGRILRLELVELVRRLPLLDGAIGGREGLLPDEGETGVREDDEPRGDQHDRDDSEYPVHRRDSRSGA